MIKQDHELNWIAEREHFTKLCLCLLPKAEQQFEAEQLYSDRRQQEEEDSEISESVAAPSQQRDLEAAVAAGAASFGGGVSAQDRKAD